MVDSYAEFASRQRAEHLKPFTRWSAVVAWYVLTLPAIAAAAIGKPKAAAALIAVSQAVIAAGHVVEGNLLEQTAITARHPVWVARADVAIATETISGFLHRR